MTKRMLIDGTHAEETRVVVLDGNRLEDFDVETSTKKQLKGNIYLAKVVRVEPSLQAAFVEYGGNRHGFLAFGEIHPDYYQIPAADRQRLIALQEEEARAAEAEEDAAEEAAARRHDAADATPDAGEAGDEQPDADAPDDDAAAGHQDAAAPLAMAPAETLTADQSTPDSEADADRAALGEFGLSVAPGGEITGSEAAMTALREALAPDAPSAPPAEAAETDGDTPGEGGALDEAEATPPETIGGEAEATEERERRTPSSRYIRNYRIQEVIRRRQIMLVQVVKEERGGKGAALTTYISLAGRFCVLMPNSPRGGGISRKITSAADRRRLKEVTAELDLPRGMGLIVRTAGAARPKAEIVRDCEYLLQLWDEIRETTLKSIAPALIYEEASLIRRAIRDVYSRDVEEVLVAGEAAWRAARDQMRLLMPSHASKVRLWADPTGAPIFVRHGVEAQLDAMFSRTVQLKSGGYLVIDQTEALVSIDVNSGRATRERNIEETALRTNLEASDEVARQLRLRDLAGLIVIDFIDMETRRHNIMVEKRLKDALKNDRARIQLGSISAFGLMEMSRQRLRPSLAETSLVACPHCEGTGHVRSTEGAALQTLRAIEEEGAKRRSAEILVHVPSAVALYMLNQKRERLRAIEAGMGMAVQFAVDASLLPGATRIDRLRALSEAEAAAVPAAAAAPAIREAAAPDEQPDLVFGPDEAAGEAEAMPAMRGGAEGEESSTEAGTGTNGGDAGAGRRRRRRRRRGGRRDEARAGADGNDAAGDDSDDADETIGDTGAPVPAPAEQAEAGGDSAAAQPSVSAADGDVAEGEAGGGGAGRRRGRRGGRRRRRDFEPDAASGAPATQAAEHAAGYVGPTPADPFGNAFDFFDALEQAEMRLAEPQPGPTTDRARDAQTIAGDRLTPEAEPAAALPEAEPVPEAEAVPAAEPAPAKPRARRSRRKAIDPDMAADAAPAAVEAPAPAPLVAEVASPTSEPEPEPAPVPQPILVDEAPAQPRRGWWRR